MIAEAEVGGDGRNRLVVLREDDSVIVGEPVGAEIDEVAVVVHRTEQTVLVEKVIVRQMPVYSPAGTVGVLAALSIAGAELRKERSMRLKLIGKSGLLQSAHVLLTRSFSTPVAYDRVGIRLLEGLR